MKDEEEKEDRGKIGDRQSFTSDIVVSKLNFDGSDYDSYNDEEEDTMDGKSTPVTPIIKSCEVKMVNI